MAEGRGGGGEEAKVRVVRCPKCEKLLPELANFTVYRCGGCDATLQAKTPIPVREASPEKLDGETVKYSENSESFSEKKRIVSDANSETDRENDRADRENDRVEFRREERLLPNKAANSSISSMSRTESRTISKEPSTSRLDGLHIGRGTEYRDSRYQRPSKAPVNDLNLNVDEMVKANLEENRKTNVQFEYNNGSRKIQQMPVWNGEVRDRAPAFRRAPRALNEGMRLAPYPDEGPSNYRLNSTYEYGDGYPAKKQDATNKVEYLEEDRSELLRKLDELRDQLSRSCEVTDKPKERFPGIPARTRAVSSSPYDHRGRRTWLPEGSSSLNRNSAWHSPFYDGRDMGMPNFYPTLPAQDDIPGFGEPFGPRPLRRAQYQTPAQYSQRPLNNYFYGQFDADPVIAYHHDGFYHQPACSCLHCYNKHWPVPAQVQPAIFSNRRVPHLGNNHGFYPVDSPPMLGSQSYNQRVTNSLHSREPQTHQRAMFAKKNGLSCRPIAGAAPFIVCYNCFELLQLPQTLPLMEKTQHKLRCGSCSQVISFEVDGKKLITSATAPTMRATPETNNDSIDGLKVGLLSHVPVISYSGDYDSPGYNIDQSIDEKIVLPSPSPSPFSSHERIEKEYGLNLSESEKVQGLSSPSSTSEDGESPESPDSMLCQGDVPSYTEPPERAELASRVPGLPLREHFGYPSNQVADRSGKGSRSTRSDQEKIISINGNFKQNSVKDVSVATEMDLSVDEYSNPGLSQDSWEASKDEDQPRINKSGDSFFAGLIKKSFRDFSRFNQPMETSKSKVSVNGHPISDRLVKKAEKQAGPIHPGEYWYDYRAGFWGVMGQPCLGIIPPLIEEFNYPMPKKCAAGNTGILVNGRELHQKDFDLLVGRGLPAASRRSYIIEISGKILDEASGEELDGLGKLAPTIEKVKHGFGMRVPRVIT